MSIGPNKRDRQHHTHFGHQMDQQRQWWDICVFPEQNSSSANFLYGYIYLFINIYFFILFYFFKKEKISFKIIFKLKRMSCHGDGQLFNSVLTFYFVRRDVIFEIFIEVILNWIIKKKIKKEWECCSFKKSTKYNEWKFWVSILYFRRSRNGGSRNSFKAQ